MFKSIVKSFGFKQLIKKCTRITETSSTTIDLILSNVTQNIPVADVIATSLSDHDMVACIRNINHQSYKPKMIKCRDYENCKDMNNIDWQPLYEIPDVNKALNYLNSTLGAIFALLFSESYFNSKKRSYKKRYRITPFLELKVTPLVVLKCNTTFGAILTPFSGVKI